MPKSTSIITRVSPTNATWVEIDRKELRSEVLLLAFSSDCSLSSISPTVCWQRCVSASGNCDCAVKLSTSRFSSAEQLNRLCMFAACAALSSISVRTCTVVVSS